ncbi:hypothetical protein AM493_16290 [Flavobacterium akiainvivens]|uniref:Uncharacterized protein n=1 Tax=Flavobacterium akiainvivens TaxID=1202724 RepID=A0A0M8MK20_9FLAO|nr:hypothetical protein [Flavobacterium akiainvivens]KOS07427.1 hypothetical protein AM493_16290 [Flavobacterium akiainvivens]SFQ48028.1 hypothetical protein SAMN05444144_105239 [Flavobacterium akiainvivens]
MTKRDQYNLAFYWKTVPGYGSGAVMDVIGKSEYGGLAFLISALHHTEVACLLDDINKILEGRPYDPDFLTSSEMYRVFNVQFKNPDFWIDGYPVIAIHDLKKLLEEWQAFLATHKNGPERKPSLTRSFKRLLVFTLLVHFINFWSIVLWDNLLVHHSAGQYLLIFIIVSILKLTAVLVINGAVFVFKRRWFIWSTILTVLAVNAVAEFHTAMFVIQLLALTLSELFLRSIEKNNP